MYVGVYVGVVECCVCVCVGNDGVYVLLFVVCVWDVKGDE